MKQKIEKLIEKYIDFLQKNPGNKDEVYKWEAISHFHKHWNPDAEDFFEMFKESFKKQYNLVHYISWSFLLKTGKYFPDKLKKLMLNLYDEQIDLETRFKNYKEFSDKIIIDLNKITNQEGHKHQQDDRTIAFLLTFRYPEKYYLYKSSIHRELCNYLEIPKINGYYKQYVQYTEIGDVFLPYIQQNTELQELAKGFIPADFPFNSDKLLFQDMVYQMLETNNHNQNDFYNSLLKIFNKKDIDYYLSFLKEIIRKAGIQYGDERCNYTITDTGIHFTIGQYYIWNLFKKKKNKFNVTSSQPISEINEPFQMTDNEPYHNKFDKIPNFTEEQKKYIFDAVDFQLNRTRKSGYRKHNNDDFEKYIFGKKYSQIENSMKKEKKYPLNQILYGPPGTGKTFKTKEIAVEIIDGNAPEQRKDIIERYNELAENGQIEFVTFHQSMNYEDFIEGIKPGLNDKNDVIYEVKNGIFKSISEEAEKNPDMNYVLIIDEINRANVSAVFGELITLIEPDKRLKKDEEIKVKLPYSKKLFGVPSNLYIVGTMNTADRSVEALDTALRRRFSFTELEPDSGIFEKLNDNNEIFKGIKKSEILETINRRIEILLDREHRIGHSYFINVDTPAQMAEVFNDKIIPLLQEYFYGDYSKIGLILGKSFVKKTDAQNIKFADFEMFDYGDFRKDIYQLQQMTAENIEEAMKNLLSNNNTGEMN